MVRIGFVTCVRLGEMVLEEILALGDRVECIVTLDDGAAQAKSGRIYADEMARKHQAELHKTRNINDAETVDWLRLQNLDWLFIIGWSQIARPSVLDVARYGTLGMHPTLLPEGRGRASIPWAIIKGLEKTGVTLYKLDSGVDTGPIVSQVELAVFPDETATTLYERVSEAHRTLIRDVWNDIRDGRVTLEPQDESKASTWPGRRPEDGELVSTMAVDEADRLVRAVTHPYPGAFWRLQDGRILRVWAGRPISYDEEVEGPSLVFRDGRYGPTDFDYESKEEVGTA